MEEYNLTINKIRFYPPERASEKDAWVKWWVMCHDESFEIMDVNIPEKLKINHIKNGQHWSDYICYIDNVKWGKWKN